MQFYSTAQKNVTCTNLVSFLERQVSHPRDEHLWPSGLWDKEEGPVSKIFFSALQASFWSKNKGGQAPLASPLDLPLLQQFWHKLQERSNFPMTRTCGSDQKRNNTLNRGPKAWNISEVLGWDFYSIEKHVPKTIHYKRANISTSLYLPQQQGVRPVLNWHNTSLTSHLVWQCCWSMKTIWSSV